MCYDVAGDGHSKAVDPASSPQNPSAQAHIVDANEAVLRAKPAAGAGKGKGNEGNRGGVGKGKGGAESKASSSKKKPLAAPLLAELRKQVASRVSEWMQSQALACCLSHSMDLCPGPRRLVRSHVNRAWGRLVRRCSASAAKKHSVKVGRLCQQRSQRQARKRCYQAKRPRRLVFAS